jgi:gliding motility-associated-like protein
LGFDFCFFGNTYNKVCISDNGHITFNTSYKNLPCSFNTQQPLPNYNNALPDNAIYAPFLDSKLSLGGSVKYYTTGTFPNRKFVVSYDNIPYFNNNCINAGNNTYQVILYEINNQIECHINSKAICNVDSTNWLNYSTIGIQNANASIAYTVPGKNAARWSATNTAYAFVPNGAPNYSLKWYRNGSFNVISNADSIYVCPTNTLEYVTMQYIQTCPGYIVNDTVFLKLYKPKIDSITIQKTTCLNTSDGCFTIYASSVNTPLTYSVDTITFLATNMICGLAVNPYAIMVKDAAGCIAKATKTISTKSTLVSILDTMIADSCPINNGTIAVHGGGSISPYTYLWNTLSTDSFITNLIGDSLYYVTIKDSLNCTKSTYYYVTQVGRPKVSKSYTNPNCNTANGSILFTPLGTNLPYTYLHSNSNTNNPAANMPPGLYSVTVTSANGCTTKISYVLADTLSTKLNIVSKVNTTCGLANGRIELLAFNAIAPYTYYANNVLLPNNIADSLAAGNYIVKAIDANGCSKTSVVIIGTSSLPTITFNPAPPNCDSINGKLGATLYNAKAPFQYTWSTGDTTSSIKGLDVGKYFVFITDSIGCNKTDTFTMTRLLPPHLQIVQYIEPRCHGDSNGSIILSGIAGIASYKYSLDSINFSAVAQINNIVAGTYTIFIKDASSCIRDTVVTFSQPSLIQFTTSTIDTLICFADALDSITITATGGYPGYSYTLDNDSNRIKNIFYNITSGIHTLVIKDARNCLIEKKLIVYGPTEPLQNIINIKDVPCFQINKGELQAIASGGWGNYKYHWSTQDSINFITNLPPNNYLVTITDNLGCTIIDSANIKQLSCCEARVPNVFTPNNSGLNDVLYVISGSEINNLRFQLFNRYGEKVFETTSIYNGWNGLYKNNPAEQGLYYFVLDFECPFQKKKIRKVGDVLLLK